MEVDVLVVLQLVVNMYVKTPKAIRAVAAGLYTEPLTRHGPPDASHWRQVLVRIPATHHTICPSVTHS